LGIDPKSNQKRQSLKIYILLIVVYLKFGSCEVGPDIPYKIMQHVVAACSFKAVKLITTGKHATPKERSLRRLHIMTLQKGEKYSVRRARKSLTAKLRGNCAPKFSSGRKLGGDGRRRLRKSIVGYM
jgi:hypothetical protein